LLSGEATAESGPVEYSFRFFRIENLSTNTEKKFKFLYNLNTLPAVGQVLYGMDVQSEDLTGKYNIEPSIVDTVLDLITQLSTQDIYWIEMK
jgi:hypothetical protein